MRECRRGSSSSSALTPQTQLIRNARDEAFGRFPFLCHGLRAQQSVQTFAFPILTRVPLRSGGRCIKRALEEFADTRARQTSRKREEAN